MSKNKKDNDGFLKDVNIEIEPDKKETEDTVTTKDKNTTSDKKPDGIETTHMAWWLIPVGLLMAAVVVWNSSIELGIAILVAAVISVVIICCVLASKKKRSRQRDGNNPTSTGNGSGSRGRRSMFRKSGTGTSSSGAGGSKGRKSRKNSTGTGGSSGGSAGKSRNPFRSRKNKNSGKPTGTGGNTSGKKKNGGSGSKPGGNGSANRYPHKGGRINPLNKGKKGISPKENHESKADGRRSRIDAKKAKEEVKQYKYDRKKDKQDRKDSAKLQKINRMDAKASVPVKSEQSTKWSRNTLNSDQPRTSKQPDPDKNDSRSDKQPAPEPRNRSKPTITPYTYNPESAKKWRDTAPQQKGNTMSVENSPTNRATVVQTVQDVANAAHADRNMWTNKSNELYESADKAAKTEGLEHTSHRLYQQASAAKINAEDRGKFSAKLIETSINRWGNQ